MNRKYEEQMWDKEDEWSMQLEASMFLYDNSQNKVHYHMGPNNLYSYNLLYVFHLNKL
jgi:hypothetical protein